MSENEIITPAVLASNLVDLTSKISRLSGVFDWCKERFYKSVVDRHGDIAELVNVPRELIDEQVRSHLTEHAMADKQVGQGLDDIRCELEEVVRDVVSARKAFSVICEFSLSKEQNLLRSVAVAESRVAELTERLKEHALNSPEVREAVWAITGGRCFYCEIDLIRGPEAGIGHVRLFHIDHLVPRSLGGPDHLANYVPACGSCNSSKHARHFAEFVMSRKANQVPPQLTVIEGGAVA